MQVYTLNPNLTHGKHGMAMHMGVTCFPRGTRISLHNLLLHKFPKALSGACAIPSACCLTAVFPIPSCHGQGHACQAWQHVIMTTMLAEISMQEDTYLDACKSQYQQLLHTLAHVVAQICLPVLLVLLSILGK